jgi:hypothetical protein
VCGVGFCLVVGLSAAVLLMVALFDAVVGERVWW